MNRTCNPQIRSLILYPVELQAQLHLARHQHIILLEKNIFKENLDFLWRFVIGDKVFRYSNNLRNGFINKSS